MAPSATITPAPFSAVNVLTNDKPIEPPHPALLAVGFKGSVKDFNDRYHAATDAHIQAVGTRPPLGVAFDIARSTVPLEAIPGMFRNLPQMQLQASARQLAPNVPDPLLTPADYIKQIEAAGKAGKLSDYMKAHEHEVAALAKNPKYGPKITRALFDANSEKGQALANNAKIFDPGIAAKAATQVAESLVHSPGGIYQAGKAVSLDTWDLAHGDVTPERTTAIVQQMGKQLWRDVRHPAENPGYLFLDVLGFASAGVGAGVRLTAGGRALAEGAGVGAAVKAVATKPRGGTFEIGRDGATEHALLSDNPLVAAAQKVRLSKKQKELDLTTVNGERAPSGLLSILQPESAREFLDQHFSFEAKVGREADARRRTEQIVNMTIARELEHVAGGAVVQSKALSRMPQRLRAGLTRGEQKAIQTVSFGVSPREQIAFHERMIDSGIGDAKAHLRQIADLKLAENVLAGEARPRFKKALELTQQVAAEMERKKIDELGLSPVTATGRMAKPAAVIREQDLVKDQTGSTFVREDGSVSSFRLERDVAQSKTVLNGERRKLATLEARLAKPSKTGQRLRRPALEARVKRQRQAVNEWAARVAEDQKRRDELGPSLAPLSTTTQTYPATGSIEPFYTKLEPRGKQKRPPSAAQGFYPTKAGPFGIPKPVVPGELTHEFTGSSIRAGNFRIDATSLTAESYARTVRTATVLNEHGRLWKSATDTKKTQFDTPIRDSRKIPDKLREVLGTMDEGTFTDKEAALLPADMQSLISELYPDEDVLAKKPIEGVKWVDSRMMGAANDIPTRPGAFGKGAQLVNEPFRILVLFARPAYILNALGNSAMLVFHQGFSAVPSMARALHAKSALGEETTRTIDALMGQGRSKSYTTAITPKVSRTLAQGWSKITDDVFRRSSFLYEAKALGYETPEQLRVLVKDGGKDLVEAKRRANKAVVEFDNLTPFEKNTLRNVIFVYPWVSRSVVWSLRSVMEHPLKTDALAQLGRQEIDSDPIFKSAPDWFKRIGYIPVGWNNDGTPKIVNPTSVNSFSTLGDLTAILGAGLGGTKYAAFSDLLGPSAKILEHGVTGKDDYGNAYPDKQWLRAAADVLTGIPQISAYRRGGKTNPPLKPTDVTQRDSFMARLNSGLKRTSLSPGWLDGYGSLLVGGMSPRGADLDALAARFWKDATPDDRHKFELTLLNKALGVQSELLKEKIPDRVKQAVTVGSNVDFVYKTFQRDNGRPPTAKERAQLLITHLDSKGLIPDGEAAKLKTQLAPMIAETDIKTLRNKVFSQHGGGDALKQWDADVRLVASFKKDVFHQKTAGLYKQGLVSSPVPGASQDDLYAYGRKYLEFTRKVVGIKDQIKNGEATAADLRAFQDANDKPVVLPRSPMMTLLGKNTGLVTPGNIDIANRPVAHNPDGSISTVRTISIGTSAGEVLIPTVINGKVVSNQQAIAYYKKTGQSLGTFSSVAEANAYSERLHQEQKAVYSGKRSALPSFTRTAWSYLPKDQQTQAVRSAAVTAWSTLTSFEKELLGKKESPLITAGWAKLRDVVAGQKAELARKGEPFPAGYRRILARYVEKNFKAAGLVKDFDFANQPLYQRLATLKPIVSSPHAQDWQQILDVAKGYGKYLKADGYNKTQVRQTWRDYVAGTLQPWVDKDPALAREVQSYGRNVLDKLLG